MTRYLSIALISVAFAGTPLFFGCDDKATSKKDIETKNPDGSSTVDKEKTTVDPKTGDAKTTTEKKVTGPTSNP